MIHSRLAHATRTLFDVASFQTGKYIAYEKAAISAVGAMTALSKWDWFQCVGRKVVARRRWCALNGNTWGAAWMRFFTWESFCYPDDLEELFATCKV